MKKVLTRSISPHRAHGEIVEMELEKAMKVVNEGQFVFVSEEDNSVTLSAIKKDDLPTMKWTEKKIKQWLEENRIPITYDIDKETKKDKLDELYDYVLDKYGLYVD